jgi:Fe-S-cluster containining protein
MKRNCSLEEISDGKLYEHNDLVEVSCDGCKGKAGCCHGMGTSIILDPYDLYRLKRGLKRSFQQLLAENIELNLIDGVILPNLRMVGENESCSFLNDSGRCSIHSHRPGICRIFPLGRYYEKGTFHYFLQVRECQNNNQTKRKVSKWIDIPDAEENKQFVISWHYFLNQIEDIIRNAQDEKLVKNLNMYLLNQFFVKDFEEEKDFYAQYYERIEAAKKLLFSTE